jgi:hypothetical protein
MKKSIFLFVISILVLTGCESTSNKELTKDISSTINIDEAESKLVCTTDYDYEDLGYVIGSKYVVWADKDSKVTKVVSEEIIESNDTSKLDEFEEYLKSNHNTAQSYGGYTYNVKRENNRVTSDVTIDYSEFDSKKFVEDNKDVGKDDAELTLDSIEAKYVTLGAECKRK